MPRTPEQFRKMREVKQKQIMNAALELFANEGYYTTSISKIAKAAGISKGLMYNYFDSKEELVVSLLKEGLGKLAELFDPNKDGVLTGDEFAFFVEKSFDAVIENPTYWRLYFSIMMQAGIHDMVKEMYASILQDTMQLLVDYYQKRGVKDPLGEAYI